MKILIVDDEPLVRKSLGRACAARGHRVTEAADGLEGLEKWKADPPDVAFIDVLMPGLSGPDLLREIGPRGETKAILMSAFSGDHDVRAGSNRTEPAVEFLGSGSGSHHVSGADLFVPKPFEDIFAVVARAEALFEKLGK